MVDIITVFSITGGIITIGFLGNLLFRKTGLPDILFLLLVGIILGPVLQVFPREALLPIIPYLTTLALMIILFDSGLNMNLYKVLSQGLRSTILAILYISFVTIGIGVVAHFLLGLNWLEAFMLSPMLAGTSSVVIIPLVSKLKMDGNIGVILLLTILEVYFTGAIDFQYTLSSIAAEFAVGIVFGFIVGIVWLRVLYLIRREEYTYILTLAMLLFSYTVAQTLGGSGALAALIFGLVLGNDKDTIKILRMKISAYSLRRVKSFLKKFHREISFLIRAIFFVFLGLIYDITGVPLLTGIIYGVTFTALALILRHAAVYIATLRSPMSPYRNLMTFMCGQGLANATLSIIVYQRLVAAGMPHAFIYPVIVVNVIIMTNIVTSISSLSTKYKHVPKKISKK
jgi:cell volume regulation protein A